MQQMTSAVEKMKADIDRLSRREQVQLLGYLMRSTHPDSRATSPQSELDAELSRRNAEIESGRDPGQSAKEVMRELREKYL